MIDRPHPPEGPAEGPDSFPVTDRNRVRQQQDRGHYDRETVYRILDQGLVAHAAFVDQGRPVVIPMTYGRDGDRLFLHGARKSRVATTASGALICIGVTLLDGLVVARSMFESSMNYRAVVLHGRARELVDGAELLHALRCVSEHNLPGRWDEVRAPLDRELKATVVLEVAIESASAKIRQGPPGDDRDADNLEVWSGVVPVITSYGAPIPDPSVPAGMAPPASLAELARREA